MRSPVVDLLADAAAALQDAGVPWYLFGAQAAILLGSLEGALGQADLLPAFESALRRADSVRNE